MREHRRPQHTVLGAIDALYLIRGININHVELANMPALALFCVEASATKWFQFRDHI